MPNNNVAILSIMSKFDEKSAREAAKRADKVYEEALSDIGNINFDKKLIENFDKAMNLLKNKFKKVNLSSYTNSLLDSIFSDKDIKEKSKDIELFISKIEMLKKASSGQDINAFNTFSAKQIDALISRTEKLAQKQEEINEKTREYNREATKIAKANRSISTIDKNYGNQYYSKTLESLKKSLGTEKEFTAEQNQSIENLAKMVNLYQVMEKSEPQKGTAEAIRYSKDLLAVTQKIKEERDKIDAFSQKGASTYINNNGLSSIDKVSDYTVNKSKEDFVKASLSNLKTQEAKLQSELTTYISESVQKNLEKVSKEVDAVVDKAEKRVENLQNKIDSLQSKPTNTGTDNSLIGNVVSESDVKTLEEIKNRLYEISKIDANGDATNQQLKEYIRLFKQYEKLALNDPGTQFDLELKEEYDSIIKYNNGLKKYADTLDNVVSKQKEFNDFSSNNQLNKKSDKSDFVDAGKIETDLNEIKETIIEISKKVDNLNSENSFNELSSQVSTLDEKLNGVNGSVDKLVESIQLLSSLSLSDLQKTLIPIYNGINQVYQDKNGKQISGYWDDLKSEIENSNTALKELLSNIGLLNKSTNSVKLIDSGLNNSGGIIGDRATIIARKNDTLSGQSQYDKSTTLKAKLDEAYEAGVNVARILDIIGTKESKVILEVQETQIGGMLGNDNLEDITKSYVNKEYLEATDEQILKLIQDIQTLEKIGLSVDLNSNNLFYDKDKGFSIIDLSTDGQFFKSYEDMIEELGYAMQGTTRQIFEDLNNIEDEPLLKAFEERFTKLSKQAQDAYANAQDSNSPSKEFEKLENDAVDGIVVGANENEEKLKNVGRQMAENVKAGFKEGISEIGSEASSDKSNISSENIIPIEDKIQDVGNGTKRIISEIGMSYDDFIKKVKSDNSLEERFAVFDKYGKVIESLKGDINSLVLPDNMNTSGASKIVHTHPSMNALGGTLSEDDYLQWYSKFISKGIGEQFELLWRGKSLNIDLSNVKEELRSSVISALVNISHVAGLQLEKSDGEIPLPLSDIYNSLSNGLLKDSVEKSGGNVTTEIIDETKNKVQNIEALISILDDFGNFRRINLGNDDAIVERIEQYKSVLKFLSEHEEYTYDQVQKILANERMTIIGTNSQGLTHNGMQLKNNTAEWMSEYLADSYSKISNLSVDSSNFDPFNMSSDAERTYADITCKYYDAIAEAMDYVVREALDGRVSENDFVSSAMSSITGEIGSLDDDEMLQAFLDSKEHVQEYIQSRFDTLKTSMDTSPMIEVKKDEQSVEEQSKETANAIDEMIAKFSSTEIENMAKALTQCMRGLSDFDEMAKSLGVTVDDLYTAQDIFNNKGLFNSLSETPIKDVFQGDDNSNTSFSSNLDEIEKEKSALLELKNTVSLITEEIDKKTQAFYNEKSAVDLIIPEEIATLESLERELKTIIESIEQISKIPINIDFNLENLDENSANVISKLKDSLSGFNGSSLTNISSILEGFKISKANVENLQKLANAILTLKSNLNNVGNSGQQFLSDIKELVAQSDGLKDLATVLKSSQKQIDNAKKTTNANVDSKNTEENTNAWKELTYSIQRYSEVSRRISSGKALEGDIEEAERLENKISQLQKLDILSPTQIEKSEQILTKLYDSLDDIEKKSKETTLESLNSSIDKYRNDYKSRSSKPFTDNQSDQYKKLLANYETSIAKLEAYRDKISNNPLVSKEDLNQIDELIKKVKKSATAFNSLTSSQKGSTPLSRGKTIEWANDLLEQNSKWSKKAKIEVQGWINKLATADPSNVEEIRNRILEVVRAEREAGNVGKTWLDIFSTKKLHNFLGQAASMFSFYDLINVGREIVTNIKEVDTALTELRKVSDTTEQRLTTNFKNSADTAKELGATISDVISATADWSRMGFDIDESEELARVSTLYKNVGDGIDIETANNSLISTLQGFQLDASEAESIIDKFNEVANNYAIDSAGIGEALQRSAASFNAANTDLSKSIALITATRLKKLVEYMETYIKNIFNCHRSLYYYTPQYRGNYYMMV